MLFTTKTVCGAGSIVYIVPTGLLVTLHYDAHGVLNKIFSGFTELQDLGEDFLKTVVKEGLVPGAIKLHGGTTDIWGVFYSDSFSCEDGILPGCEFDSWIEDIKSGSPNYKFYIGNVESKAMAITPVSMQSWTKMMGFETLPCWAVPIEGSDAILKSYINNNIQIPFKYPLLSGFIIFEGQSPARYHALNLRTVKINSTVRDIDQSGYILYHAIYGTDNKITMNYPDAVHFNVQVHSRVVLDGNTVIWCDTEGSTNNPLSRRITCTTCGKVLDIPEQGPVTCDDEFCKSRLYPRIQRFCNILNLPIISYDAVSEYIAKDDLLILPDLLLLDEYRDLKIEATLVDVIFASISGDVGVSLDWLKRFCNKCNNSYDTVKYYFNGPVRIRTELDMDLPKRLGTWLNNSRNLVELDTIIHSEQIQILNFNKITKFDGAPLLRDKVIYITGTFLHGSYDDIVAIIHSYSGIVSKEFNENVHCVLVGDIKENIDGLAVKMAKESHLPMFDESAFFARYQIDEDLEKYLL